MTGLWESNIPQELRDDPAWVLWRYEERKEKTTKVPYQPDGRRADSTDKHTWATFEAVVAAYQRGGWNGIGFVFHEDNPYAGADFDDMTEDQVREWIDEFDSYTERSPSGNGYHIICKAELPKGTNRTEGELYSSERFFTMTGDVVRARPVREAQDVAEKYYAHLRRNDNQPSTRPWTSTSGATRLTDSELISKAENAKNGAKFQATYRGGGDYKSDSERDMALASMTAFYTDDEDQIERVMLGSGCAREKWDKHRTYLRDTIRKAIESKQETYSPGVLLEGTTTNGHGGGASIRDAAEPDKAPSFNTTDMGNAARMVHRYSDRLHYCYPWGKWIVFDGRRWKIDDNGAVYRLAKETVAAIYREAADAPSEDRRKALAKHAMRSEGGARIREMIELARSDVAITPDELDTDPWLLNCKNGTVDLRTGELRPHDRRDLITKLAPVEYDPNAAAPAWEKFLQRALPGEEKRGFVQRGTGYSATGDTSEQVIFIHHGPGANGKSTFMEAVSGALGDYAMRTPTETLLAKRPGGVPNDVARLKGSRLVRASETEEGRRLDESLIKDLTGGDTISARYMRAEWFDFVPSHKLHLSTNHRPEIRGTDNAIWRRIRLIPWGVKIPPAEQDKKLPEKLRDELPGVLAWIVRGCLEWGRTGLQAPDEVKAATEGYRADMDVLGTFIEECCVVSPAVNTKATPLYQAFRQWAAKNNENEQTQKRFGMWLAERGFEREKVGVYYWLGIGLRHTGDDDPTSGPSRGVNGPENNKHPRQDGSDGPTVGPSRPNGPTKENTEFAGETQDDATQAGPSGPQNNINSLNSSREEVIWNKGPKGPKGPDRPPGDVEDQGEKGPVWLD